MNAERGTMKMKLRKVEMVQASREEMRPSFLRPRSPLRSSSSSLSFRVHAAACIVLLFLICASLASAAGVWTKQRSGTLAWLHAVYFLDQQKGWAVGGGGTVLKTTDGGESWQMLPHPTNDALRDVYFADERNGWIVCEKSLFALKSNDDARTYLMSTTNGGQTWQLANIKFVNPSLRLVRTLFTGDGHGWAFGEAGTLYTTHDGGAKWIPQPPPTRYLLLGGASLNSQQIWLVGAGSTILQTNDGGQTWRTGTVLGAPESFPGVRFTAASFVDNRHGWAVGTEGHVFTTRDGGRTWRAQNSNVQVDLMDVKFIDAAEGWAIGAEGALIHTVDGGLHWTSEQTGTTHPLERLFFTGREHGWAVGFGGTIINFDSSRNAPSRAPTLKN